MADAPPKKPIQFVDYDFLSFARFDVTRDKRSRMEAAREQLNDATAAVAADSASQPNRNIGLDVLKAAMVVLVIFHHTAITYGAIGDWFYRELPADGSLQSTLLVFFCTVNQAYFMGVFFLIAGYFTCPALARKGALRFLRDRSIRLGVPLLLFGFVLGPITVALAQIPSEQGFWKVLFALWRKGAFYVGPLWFAEALLLFSLGAVLWRILRVGRTESASAGSRRKLTVRRFPGNRPMLLAAIACGLVAFCLRLIWPVGSQVLGLQLGYFASYILFFAFGYAAWDARWLERVPDDTARLWRRIAVLTLPALLPVALLSKRFAFFGGTAAGGWNIPSAMYALWEPFVAFGVILALLRYFQIKFNDLTDLRRKLSRRAFGMYVIHPPILVAISLALRIVHIPALGKFAVTGSATAVTCFWLTGLLLRSSVLRVFL